MNWSDFLQAFKNPFNIFILILVVLLAVFIIWKLHQKVNKKLYENEQLGRRESLDHQIKYYGDKLDKLEKALKEQEKLNSEAFTLLGLKLDVLESFNSDFEEEILEALYLVPNKKFTDALDGIDKDWNKKKEELKKTITTQYNKVVEELAIKNQKIEELNLELKEKEQLIKQSQTSNKKVKIKIKKE